MVEPFYGTSGPRNARVMIVAESWGQSEAQHKEPLIGVSGTEFTRMLSEAGIDRSQCLLTNVVAEQPFGNDMRRFFLTNKGAKESGATPFKGLFPKPIVFEHLKRLYAEIEQCDPELIIGLGNYSLWALTDDFYKIGSASSPDYPATKVPTGIAVRRGSQLRTNLEAGARLFLPTFHPAAILRQWSWRNIAVQDLRRAQRYEPGDFPDWHRDAQSFDIRPSFERVMQALHYLNENANETPPLDIAVDLETRHFKLPGGRTESFIACAGLAWSQWNAICIPFMCVESHEGFWRPEEEIEIILALRKLLSNPNVRVTGQNFGYDLQYIAKEWFFVPHTYHDTMMAQNLLWPGTPKALHYLASMFAKYYVYWKDEGKEWDPKVPEEQLWNYNCLDACYTFEVRLTQERLIREFGLEAQWEEQMEFFHLGLEMMLRGVRIDKKFKNELAIDLMASIQERQQWLYDIIPLQVSATSKKPWYSSPQQQQVLFYEILGQTTIKKRGTGRPTVDDEALELLKRRCAILRKPIEKLQEMRSLGVFHNNFATATLELDGRMKCMYNTGGTETFRWSSSKNAFDRGTNLQNIPKGTEDE